NQTAFVGLGPLQLPPALGRVTSLSNSPVSRNGWASVVTSRASAHVCPLPCESPPPAPPPPDPTLELLPLDEDVVELVVGAAAPLLAALLEIGSALAARCARERGPRDEPDEHAEHEQRSRGDGHRNQCGGGWISVAQPILMSTLPPVPNSVHVSGHMMIIVG